VQRADLGEEPASARGFEIGGCEIAQQRIGFRDQHLRRERILLIHACRELGRAVVGLHELVHMLAGAEAELEVALDQVHRSKSAA
jgi:hypothetical protein